jgi:hypothetical protein
MTFKGNVKPPMAHSTLCKRNSFLLRISGIP